MSEMSERIAALWAAMEACPQDQLLRGVLADAYRDEGRDDEADAVLASADKWPYVLASQTEPSWFNAVCAPLHNNVDRKLWDRLSGDRFLASWKQYPSFLLAMLDLIRAWVAGNRPSDSPESAPTPLATAGR